MGIRLPPRSAFVSPEAYAGTLSHELVHWSGAPHRLARDLTTRFRTRSYAAEELVAELGAAFVLADLGLARTPHPNHAAYVASWLPLLRSDPHALATAATQAAGQEDAGDRDPARGDGARHRPQKAALARDLVAGGRSVSAVASALGVSRPYLASSRQPMARRRGRPPAPDTELLAAIQALIADLPTYGYRRVHALLRRQAEREGRPTPNVKRVYRVMKVRGLLLQRHAGGAEARRHEGKVAVAVRNTRWCSDGLEIAAENGERVRVAFALDCCDREAMSYVATTAGITGEDVCDLMVMAVEHRFGRVNQLPSLIEWLTDNGSGYLARDTRRFARNIGLLPKTTPLESPQSNGMAEAFVRTLKRDYVRVSILPDAESVLRQLPLWLAHYNDLRPHRALGYRSPREFIARSTQETLSGL